ncbi:MAG: EutN/CcmL family microcompartment protein [Planctomycetaceae bacterium]|nr:EutN/CcmL family microcompartment protein [Planctomycetaceae bacterium]
MQLAQVHGTATATVKTPALRGWKLLIVQPLLADGTPDGYPMIAIDNLGSRVGDIVMLTTDGSAVRDIMNNDATPVRYAVVGIKDED